VLFASLDDGEREALGETRVRLQAEISAQVRLKRTPQLTFDQDPAVEAGQRVEEILRSLPERDLPAGDDRLDSDLE